MFPNKVSLTVLIYSSNVCKWKSKYEKATAIHVLCVCMMYKSVNIYIFIIYVQKRRLYSYKSIIIETSMRLHIETYDLENVYLQKYTYGGNCIHVQQVFHSGRHTLRFWKSPAIFPPFGGQQSGTLHFVRNVVQKGKAVRWYPNALLRTTLQTCPRKPSPISRISLA